MAGKAVSATEMVSRCLVLPSACLASFISAAPTGRI